MTEPSVTSRVSRSAGHAVPARAAGRRRRRGRRRAGCGRRGSPRRRGRGRRLASRRTAASDVSRTWVVSGPIRPLRSAIGMNSSGAIAAELGVLPADQRLDAGDLAGAQPGLGLDVHLRARRAAAPSRSSDTRVSRRGLVGVQVGLVDAQTRRVDALASYIAMSARLSSVAGVGGVRGRDAPRRRRRRPPPRCPSRATGLLQGAQQAAADVDGAVLVARCRAAGRRTRRRRAGPRCRPRPTTPSQPGGDLDRAGGRPAGGRGCR